MKALSVKQPWANMIASGEKTIETRTWETNYRGVIAIASSKMPDIYPAGCVILTAYLVNCRPMVKSDEKAACCECLPGLYSWCLVNVEKLEVPLKVKGQQGLYDIKPKKLTPLF